MGVKKHGTSVLFGVQAVLDEAPGLTALLGAVSVAWAQLELSLAQHLGYMISAPLPVNQIKPLDKIANEIFDAVELIGQRLNILRGVFRARVKDESLKTELEDVLDTIRKASKHRGMIVHSLWGVSKEYPGQLIRAPSLYRMDTENLHPMGAKELAESIKIIADAQRKVDAFFEKVRLHLDGPG